MGEEKLEAWKCPNCSEEIKGSLSVVLILSAQHKCEKERPERVFFRTKTEADKPKILEKRFKFNTTTKKAPFVIRRKKLNKCQRIIQAIETGRHTPKKIMNAAKTGKSTYGLLCWLVKKKSVISVGKRPHGKYYLPNSVPSQTSRRHPHSVGSGESLQEKVIEAVNAGNHTCNEITAFCGKPRNTVSGTVTWLTGKGNLKREGTYGKYRWYSNEQQATPSQQELHKRQINAKMQMIEDSLRRNKIFASEPVKKLLLKTDGAFHIIQYLAVEKVRTLNAPMILKIRKNFQNVEKAKNNSIAQAFPEFPRQLLGKLTEEQLIDFVKFYSETKKLDAADFIRLCYGATDEDSAQYLFKTWFIPNAKAIIEYALRTPVIVTYSQSDFILTWKNAA